MKFKKSLLALASCAMMAAASQAHATTISPNITTDPAVGTDMVNCSLRYAVISINNGAFEGGCGTFASGTFGTDDTIILDADTYALTIGADVMQPDETGDLDVTVDLAITGAGSDQTTIDASGMAPTSDRVIEVGDVNEFSMTGVTVTGGDASPQGGDGGGINSEAQLVELSDVHLIENTAISGGGIAHIGGTGQEVTMVNSTVEFNHAVDGCGGGLRLDFPNIIGPMTDIVGILNSTINNNDTNSDGGGICDDGSHGLFIANSTVFDNTAGSGGGGISSSGGLKGSYNVTIAFNQVTSTDGFGGGLAMSAVQIGDFPEQIFNTIVAENTATNGPDCSGTFLTGGNNLIGDIGGTINGTSVCNGFTDGVNNDQVGSSATPIDPVLDPTLQVNGGTTKTLALLTGSPAIDKGDPDGCQVLDFQAFVDSGLTNPTFINLTSDQRGLTRPVAILDPNVPICDIGAFEVQLPTPSPSPSPSPTPTAIPTNNLEIFGNGCSLSAIAGSPATLLWMGLALLAGWFQLRTRK